MKLFDLKKTHSFGDGSVKQYMFSSDGIALKLCRLVV